jgi:hypothetical protein
MQTFVNVERGRDGDCVSGPLVRKPSILSHIYAGWKSDSRKGMLATPIAGIVESQHHCRPGVRLHTCCTTTYYYLRKYRREQIGQNELDGK